MFTQNPTEQLALNFDPDLATQHRTLKECVACQMYQQRGGITAVAGKLDLQPSHLSEVLGSNNERHRKFDLDELERYIAAYNDLTPIMYLIAKYMPEAADAQAHALQQLAKLSDVLPGLLASAGLNTARGSKRR